MSYRVLKFGGSSLGSADGLRQVIELIAAERRRGPVAVVCSAMGDSTDRLIEAADIALRDLDGAKARVDDIAARSVDHARSVVERFDPPADDVDLDEIVTDALAPLRELLLGVNLLGELTDQTRDLILSFGERLSATIVSELVDAAGVPSVYCDSRSWTVTDDTFGHAQVDWESTRDRIAERRPQWGDRVSVHTGFLGKTPDGRTTTLGRNGSDYTATLLARGLDAEEVIVCTDVAGVMTADPLIVDDAYPVDRLSYREALELANYGARMFHNRTMLPLIESGIPMRIRNTMDPDEPGTRIDATGIGQGDRPTCVTSLENLALIDVRWRELSRQARMGRRVLKALEAAEITVWMATQAAHGQAVAVAVPASQLPAAKEAIEEELRFELERHEVEPLDVRAPVTLLSLVAEEMRDTDNVAGPFFQSLGAVGINVQAIAQGESSRSISCVIDADDTREAVRTVHAAFNFAHQEINLVVLGCGVVGSELLDQIAEQHTTLKEQHDVDVRVVGLANSSRMAVDADGLDMSRWREVLQKAPPQDDETDAIDRALEVLPGLSVPIVVDVTASDAMGTGYRRAFEAGIHVVAANKKPLTASCTDYRALKETARSEHRAFHYETTVGASLPVVDTLQNLIRTGDRVQLVEGAFSGTLGYLTNEVMDGTPLSKAVRTARQLGYTEPQPQDDLSGLDVARKALILARELGLDMEMSDVTVEPLVPESLLETRELEPFFSKLEDFDDEFGRRVDDIKQQDKVLRYLAILELDADGDGRPQFDVGPVAVGPEHPAAQLRGSEAFVAFTTSRYQDYPLIVRGAGAGGAVTAAGVLSDVLRISHNLRGR